jgi:vanillate O-demethylase ferredoxin subunit
MKLLVDKIIRETPEILTFRLVHPAGAALPAYQPGAHVDITGPTGITRQYSLCGHPDDQRAYLVAVKREAASRGGSSALHDSVCQGDTLQVGAPRNLFALDPAAPEHLLFGAGIGITPLLAMAHALGARGQRYTLHYFARAPEHAAFSALLASAPFAPHVRFHYGVQPSDLAPLLHASLEQAQTGSAAHVYTCGPAAFMDLVVASAAASRPEERIHLEHFQAAPPAPAGADRGFEVRLARSGRVLEVPSGVTLVEALAAAGIAVDTSCREGICGTCVVPLLAGAPDHRDHCLSKKEKAANDQICACVSRARSAQLVLDL